jgi:uncharacterized protein YjlB
LVQAHHYHSTSHEVLCVIGGSASITFGGPEGQKIEVSAGDAVVIPAGVGHCNEGYDGGFFAIGAYPMAVLEKDEPLLEEKASGYRFQASGKPIDLMPEA